ncbi:MAG: four helix bundle protein, partial [Polyangiales bacterium]
MQNPKTPPFSSNHHFRALSAAYSLISALAPVVSAVGRHDRALRDQLRRAGSSIPLNLAEG